MNPTSGAGFSLAFTTTPDDFANAYDAVREAESGMRPWVRGVLVLLGFVWVFGFVVMFPESESPWGPLASLAIGLAVLWNFLFHPLLVRRRLRMENPQAQSVVLGFTKGGIHVRVGEEGESVRTWNELVGTLPAKQGVLFSFADGKRHWVPARGFRDGAQRKALLAFIAERGASALRSEYGEGGERS